MGFFSYLLGTGADKPAQKSTVSTKTEHAVTADKIRQLVSRVKIQSLDQTEEKLVEEAIIARRRGDGKISLEQIDELLRKLKNQNKISDVDRRGLVRVFQQYFESQFSH